ncbi:hypothetical protein ACNUDN_06076 [Mycobacterium sp. smrl_JER01]
MSMPLLTQLVEWCLTDSSGAQQVENMGATKLATKPPTSVSAALIAGLCPKTSPTCIFIAMPLTSGGTPDCAMNATTKTATIAATETSSRPAMIHATNQRRTE